MRKSVASKVTKEAGSKKILPQKVLENMTCNFNQPS